MCVGAGIPSLSSPTMLRHACLGSPKTPSYIKGTVSSHSVLEYLLILICSMYAAAAPLVVADDSLDETACLEVGSTIEISTCHTPESSTTAMAG